MTLPIANPCLEFPLLKAAVICLFALGVTLIPVVAGLWELLERKANR